MLAQIQILFVLYKEHFMNRNKGFTLIEIMISLVLGIIVIGGALSIYISTIKSSTDTIKSSRLNYDMDSVLLLMINDIKRAGYWGGSVIGSDSRANPFSIGVADIQIPVSTCILYTYDSNNDGTVNNGEFFGFKLANNEINISSADTVDATGNCSVTDGRWQTITDSDKVEFTGLQFSFLPIGTLLGTTRCLNTTDDTNYPDTCVQAEDDGNLTIDTGDQVAEKRVINIVLTGRVEDDDTVTKLLSGTIQVRNDKVFTQ